MSMRRLLGKLGYTLPLAALVLATCGVAAPPRPTPDPFAGQYSATGGGGAPPPGQGPGGRLKGPPPPGPVTARETGAGPPLDPPPPGGVGGRVLRPGPARKG